MTERKKEFDAKLLKKLEALADELEAGNYHGLCAFVDNLRLKLEGSPNISTEDLVRWIIKYDFMV